MSSSSSPPLPFLPRTLPQLYDDILLSILAFSTVPDLHSALSLNHHWHAVVTKLTCTHARVKWEAADRMLMRADNSFTASTSPLTSHVEAIECGRAIDASSLQFLSTRCINLQSLECSLNVCDDHEIIFPPKLTSLTLNVFTAFSFSHSSQIPQRKQSRVVHAIGSLHSLRSLELRLGTVDPYCNFIALSTLPSLERLTFDWNSSVVRLSVDQWKCIASIPNLKYLAPFRNRMQLKELQKLVETLPSSTKLEELDLGKVCDAEVTLLLRIPTLTRIDFTHTEEENLLQFLPQFECLRSLSFSMQHDRQQAKECFEQIGERLLSLTIHNTVTDGDLQCILAYTSKLQRLTLLRAHLTCMDSFTSGACKRTLQSLSMFLLRGASLKVSSFQKLHGYSSLTHFSIAFEGLDEGWTRKMHPKFLKLLPALVECNFAQTLDDAIGSNSIR